MGNIRRLTTAVVVNHRKDVDKAGKPITKALPEAELKQIGDLVREAMGYSKERGDSVSLANAPFTEVEKTETGLPIWKDPENISYVKDLLRYVLIAAIIGFLYLKIIQPSLKTMFPPPAEAEPSTVDGVAGAVGGVHITGEGEEGEDALVHIDHYGAKIQKARDIAQNDPKAVANIIKEWITANAS